MRPPPDAAVERTAARSLPRRLSSPAQDVAERRRRAAREREPERISQALPQLTSMMVPRRPQAGPDE
jgi:hypothetical protein